MAVDRGENGDTPRRHPERPDSPDQPAIPARPTVLEDPERRAAESRLYFAIVERVFSAARDTWSEELPGLRASWEKHVEEYPAQGKSAPRTQPDGSWVADEGRKLSPEQNAEAAQVCADIRVEGKNVILPVLERIEAADPNRRLAGLRHMLKGEDRLKEKIAEGLRYHPDRTAKQSIVEVPDAVRFTLAYSESRYTDGVRSDVERLKAMGFEPIKLKNLWAKEQYRGINSQWRAPDTGLRFEVQFHTPTSFEAKELTHEAYERLRDPTTSKMEEVQLEDYQRLVTSKIPLPPNVFEIEDYPPEKLDGR